ncbi:MAG: pilus assembly protein PilM [Candidatus Pacebacteria bacterium]|nr:pilus assembly protein PilM [Candidatus Paceibacterota bacterium]
MSFAEKLLHSFPVPSRISMPAVGLDISDHSVKFLELVHGHGGYRVGRFATKEIPEGIIVGGTITQRDALVALLSDFRKEHNLTFVRASLPEEPGYIFTTRVPQVAPEETRSLLRFKLEEHVPIAPAEAVVDYDVVTENEQASLQGQKTVAVSVFPEKLAQDYADLLHASGLTTVSLEIEAQAIARAVIPKGTPGACMVIDIGRMRSGITVSAGGAVRFTTTVDTGGDTLTTLIKQAFPKATDAEILRIKNEEGLSHEEHAGVKDAMEKFAGMLRGHIERYYLYWQTHKENKEGQGTPIVNEQIQKIIISGGYANIAGLPEYLARELRVKCERANVWVNAFPIEKYIPPIAYRESLAYASAIGLALHKDNE